MTRPAAPSVLRTGAPFWRLEVTRYRVVPPGWPPGLRLRVALLADLHACAPWMDAARIAEVVARANALGPDLTLLLGDFAGAVKRPFLSRVVPPEEWAPPLAALRAPLGRWAVLGNHDWTTDRAAQARGAGPTEAHAALERAGVPVLENRAVRLGDVWVAGLGDQRAFPQPRRPWRRKEWRGVDDLPATLAQATDDAPVLLMAHEPDVFPAVRDGARAGVLTLSGHTHGGQVRLMGRTPVVPSRYGSRYAYGHVVERRPDGGEAHLVVSGGLGCSGLPIRWGRPPEIVLLELG